MHWQFDTSLILLCSAFTYFCTIFLMQSPRSWLGAAVRVRGADSYTGKGQSCPAQFPFEELRGNRELVLGALQENGLMLEHASQDLRGDGIGMHWP